MQARLIHAFPKGISAKVKTQQTSLQFELTDSTFGADNSDAIRTSPTLTYRESN